MKLKTASNSNRGKWQNRFNYPNNGIISAQKFHLYLYKIKLLKLNLNWYQKNRTAIKVLALGTAMV